MNKLRRQNSAIKTPLNDLLGSKGQVMVLRQLAEADHPVSHSELLDRTSLSRQGVYDVIHRLAENGLVEYVGSGNLHQVILSKSHPLAGAVKKLFAAEKKRYDNLIKNLIAEIRNMGMKPKAAWISGKLPRRVDEYGDPVSIALLGEVQAIDDITDEFKNRLHKADIEKEFDVTIEINSVTLADIETKPRYYSDSIISLWGPDPQYYLNNSQPQSKPKNHQALDQESRAYSRAWIELLKGRPEIIERTLGYLEESIPQIHSGGKKELQEWKHILGSMSFQRLKKFLASDSQRSARLRQSNPFWLVLKESEREKLEEIKIEQNPGS
jgi:predicted DNA-binding protein YlxM (UPF0122 family)